MKLTSFHMNARGQGHLLTFAKVTWAKNILKLNKCASVRWAYTQPMVLWLYFKSKSRTKYRKVIQI